MTLKLRDPFSKTKHFLPTSKVTKKKNGYSVFKLAFFKITNSILSDKSSLAKQFFFPFENNCVSKPYTNITLTTST